eukprot:8623906-Pyramimonas_sp.AAC.1
MLRRAGEFPRDGEAAAAGDAARREPGVRRARQPRHHGGDHVRGPAQGAASQRGHHHRHHAGDVRRRAQVPALHQRAAAHGLVRLNDEIRFTEIDWKIVSTYEPKRMLTNSPCLERIVNK